MFLQLDENVLNSELNPFQFNSTTNSEEVISIMDYVELFIVEDLSPTHEINSQTNSVSNPTSSNELSTASHNIELSIIFDSASILPSSTPNTSNTVIPQNNISTNNVDNDNTEDDSVAENSVNSQIDSQNPTTSSNEYQIATQSIDENNTQTSRIIFSHDVHLEQKHQYSTNTYKLTGESYGTKKNNGTSCIQGVKTKEEMENRVQVLPHLQISRWYLSLGSISLLLYAVFEEEEEDGTRIWYKNYHKGFLLPDQIKKNAKFVNPILIPLDLNNKQWNANGDYTLEIYMLTMIDKENINTKEEIYRLDKEATNRIHKAKHIKCSERTHLKPTRILAVIRHNNTILWYTAGISNFIQPHKKDHQPEKEASNNITTVQLALSAPKRKRTE